MSLTPSNMLPLGTIAPNFKLLDVTTNSYVSINDSIGKFGTVIMFICNHCPFVVHILNGIIELAYDYQKKDIGFVAISSNDVINYPDDDPKKMKELALENNFPFYYLYDESQEIAKAYDAACTPDFSVFDQELNCIYRGQMDDARPGNEAPNNGKDLRMVLDYLLDGKKIDFEQKPSLGCNIKWK